MIQKMGDKLKGDGFILRHIKMSDAKRYFECFRDKESKRGFMTFPKNLGEAKKEIQEKISAMRKKKPTGETFAIIVDGDFAGYVEIDKVNGKFHEHQANIGYCLDRKFRGKGITTNAVKLITNYAFKKYKLKRIDGWCRTFNKASARVLEKAGYKLEGILRKNKCKNGRYYDDMVWARVK